MQRYSQHPRADGAFVAIDPFRPSVSLGIKNIITGQNDPTIDDIPVTRPQPQQQYTIPYEGRPYVQPGTYMAQPVIPEGQPYSQPIYATHSQPIYQPWPHTQPISQPVYSYPPNFRPPYPTQPTVILPQPSGAPVVIVPAEESSSESRRGHAPGRHARSPRRSQSRSESRRSSIRRYSQSPRRHSPNKRHHSRRPQRPWLSRLWSGRKHRAHTSPHRPGPSRHHRRSPERVDSAPSTSEVRGRSRSPKPLGAKESDETGSSSGDVSPSRPISRSPPLAYVLPSRPFVPPVDPRRSPPPAHEQRLGSPRVSPTSPRFSATSPRHSPSSPHHFSTSPRRRYPVASSHELPFAPPPASQGSTRSAIPSPPAAPLSSASRSRSRSPRRSPQVDHEHPRPASGSRRSRSPRFLAMPSAVIIQPPAARPAWRQISRSQSDHRRRSRSSSPSRQARRHNRSHSRERRRRRRRDSWDEWRLPQDERPYRGPQPPVVMPPELEPRRPHWDSRLPRRHYRRSRSRSSSSPHRRRRTSRSPPLQVPAGYTPFIPPHSGPHAPMYAPPTTDAYKPHPYVAVQPLPERNNQEYYNFSFAVQPRITAYVTAFLLDTVPRQIYLHFMLRLPSLYFNRVTRIFEDAEMSMPEIKKMALEAASKWKDPAKDLNRGFIFDPQELSPPYASLQNSWQNFIDSLMREWKTLNVISVLLLSCVYRLSLTGFIDSTLVQRHLDNFAN